MPMNEEDIKDRLISGNPDFRRLCEKHSQYEGRLHELLTRHHMTEHDQLEQNELKKKKLHLKDQMNAMIAKFRNQLSHQHT